MTALRQLGVHTLCAYEICCRFNVKLASIAYGYCASYYIFNSDEEAIHSFPTSGG